MPRQDLIQMRRGTAALWTSTNPILEVGELGFETDTLKYKLGDGVTVWTSLSYPAGGGGAVSSVFGRSGAVVSATNDYTASQVANVAAGGISATNLQAAINELDTEKANIASPTLTGVPVAPTPSSGDNTTKIATTAFVQAEISAQLAGIRWKFSVKVATTANGALATAYENGDTVDGVTLVTGDRILIKNQSTQTENGIYVVNASGAPTRSTDADTGVELQSAVVSVDQGTTNGDTSWRQTTDNVTIGSSNIIWTVFGSSSGVSSFNSRTGAVSPASGDYTAAQITNTPAGGIAAITAQAAINELDSEKVNKTDFVALTDGATITWNQGNEQNPLGKITLGASGRNLDITNAKSGASGIIQVTNGIAGANTLNFVSTTYTHKTDNGTFTSWPFPAGSGITYDCSFYVDGTTIKWIFGISNIDTDPTMAADSDLLVPSQKAVNTKFTTKENVGVAQVLDNLLPWKYVKVRTTAPLPTNTANGGYTVLTMSAVGVITVDGVALVSGDRVMINDETDAKKNGLYSMTTEGTAGVAAVFTRTSDGNSGAKLDGVIVNVQRGTTYGGGTLWFQTTPSPALSTDSISFSALPGIAGDNIDFITFRNSYGY